MFLWQNRDIVPSTFSDLFTDVDKILAEIASVDTTFCHSTLDVLPSTLHKSTGAGCHCSMGKFVTCYLLLDKPYCCGA
ncbi:hypothetical protein T01_4239 [Trichinella spiralis]|uniref:Uncharacterized protein n=1 Tax=Trichinella spiralis TaxID=6334 RepID=A0A0V1BV65_TRISP|nr:hypothetical protein T01_4239 [Trichinella spiralis]